MFDLLRQLFEAFANMLNTTYIALYVGLVDSLTKTLVPSVTMLQTDWLRSWIGGSVGLARALVILVTLVAGIRMMVGPFKPHGRTVANLISSMGGLILFIVLFYPLNDLALSLSATAKDGILELVTQGKTDTLSQMFQTVVPQDDIFAKILSIGFLSLFGLMAYLGGIAINIAIILVAVFYPLAVVMKAAGSFFENMFHFFNALLIAAIASPPLMVLFVSLPLIVKQFPFGGLGIVQVLTTMLGCFLAGLTPVILAVLAYRKSNEVFGTLQASIAGAVDVASMPSVSVEDWKNQSSGSGALSAFASSIFLGGATVVANSGTDDLGSKMKHVVADAAAAAATASGHAEIGIVIQGLDSASRAREEKKAAEAEAAAAETQSQPTP